MQNRVGWKVVGSDFCKMAESYILRYNAVPAIEKLQNKNTITAKIQARQQPMLLPAKLASNQPNSAMLLASIT